MAKAKNSDLHGNVPDSAPTALVIIDMLSSFDFPGSTSLLAQAEKMAPRLAELKAAFRRRGFPVIYTNDNSGKWRSSREALLEQCTSSKSRGRKVAEILRPDDDDYFIIKPKHSAFYQTSFELVLQYLDVKNLVLTGMAGENCVYFTAADAYLRDYELFVPSDTTVSIDPAENKDALRRMRRLLKVDTMDSRKLLRQRRLFQR